MPYKDPYDERNRAARRKHYYNNKDQYLERNKIQRHKITLWVKKYKESRPCMDCNIFYPACVMDFDHRDPKIKTKAVSKLLGYSFKRVKEEISKCDLVCANCHRIRTHKPR